MRNLDLVEELTDRNVEVLPASIRAVRSREGKTFHEIACFGQRDNGTMGPVGYYAVNMDRPESVTKYKRSGFKGFLDPHLDFHQTLISGTSEYIPTEVLGKFCVALFNMKFVRLAAENVRYDARSLDDDFNYNFITVRTRP